MSASATSTPPSIRFNLWGLRGLTLVAFSALWELLHFLNVFPDAAPSLGAMGRALGRVLASATFWEALSQTLRAAMTGWFLAVLAGAVLGVAIGTNAFMARSSSVLVEFGRSFPVIAILPVVVLVIGANIKMEIFMVFMACFWPVLVQSIAGSRRQDSAVQDTVNSFRTPWFLKFRKVTIPAALPLISTGIRIAASIAILVAVSVGVLSQTPGLGRQITLAQEAARWDIAFVYLIFTGLVGWGLTSAIAAIENRALRWNRQAS